MMAGSIWDDQIGAPDHLSGDIRRILYIDAYDSFTHNIIDLLERTLKVVVRVIRIDTPLSEDLQTLADRYDAIVAGPGPGSPTAVEDIGHMKNLWKLKNIPVLGICLGFQSLCCEHGANIGRLREPRHGRVVKFRHSADDIFSDLPSSFYVTLYHSLGVALGHPLEKDEGRDVVEKESLRWTSTQRCENLQPLAWYWEEGPSQGATLMAVRHKSKPFWGVQFHPESCKSDDTCTDLVRNWWAAVLKHNDRYRPFIDRPQLFSITNLSHPKDKRDNSFEEAIGLCSFSGPSVLYRVICQQDGIPDANKISELVGIPQVQGVVLEVDSRYSIISVPSPGSWSLQYSLSDTRLQFVSTGRKYESKVFNARMSEVHDLVRSVMNAKRADGGHIDIPFWGGYLGYFSYEAGTDMFDIPGSAHVEGEKASDVSLLWVERSIVIDKNTKNIYIQSLIEADDGPSGWLDIIERGLAELTNVSTCTPLHPPNPSEENLIYSVLKASEITPPDEHDYKRRIEECQEYIRRGDSYELCLTAETKISFPQCKDSGERNLRSWLLYKRLQQHNPARYSGYAGIGDAKVVSSSPELFMRWGRNGTFEMKPMKGTVKKTPDMTLEKATDILNTPKEMGENLMIADLIRHDMASLCGSGNVEVVQAMAVEDHTLVYQLITHVKGFPRLLPPVLQERNVPPQKLRSGNDHDALFKCLPPGSMTGAPKKRSCEILDRIEERKRGIYSGTMGFFDVGGGGSFSVLIRTAFSLSHGTGGKEIWRIGAGGAITALSTPQGEWDEIVTKLDTVLAVFQPSEVSGEPQLRQNKRLNVPSGLAVETNFLGDNADAENTNDDYVSPSNFLWDYKAHRSIASSDTGDSSSLGNIRDDHSSIGYVSSGTISDFDAEMPGDNESL